MGVRGREGAGADALPMALAWASGQLSPQRERDTLPATREPSLHSLQETSVCSLAWPGRTRAADPPLHLVDAPPSPPGLCGSERPSLHLSISAAGLHRDPRFPGPQGVVGRVRGGGVPVSVPPCTCLSGAAPRQARPFREDVEFL